LGRKRLQLIWEQIHDEYLAGNSTYSLAKKYLVSDITIRRILKATSTNMRSVGIPRVHHFNCRIFDNIDSFDKAYWLGFLYADGSVNWINRSMNVSLIDKDHLIKFQEFLGSDYNIKFIENRNIYSLSISSIDLVKDLIKHGCMTNKSKRLRYPSIPSDLDRDFVRGYFDGDGCWSTNFQKEYFYFDIVSCSLPILEGIQQIIVKECNLNMHKIYHRWNSYYLRYGGPQIFRIGRYLYPNANIILDRKYLVFENFEKWYNEKYYQQTQKDID
jgi:intein-encoded DNA endonuclease-like protein